MISSQIAAPIQIFGISPRYAATSPRTKSNAERSRGIPVSASAIGVSSSFENSSSTNPAARPSTIVRTIERGRAKTELAHRRARLGCDDADRDQRGDHDRVFRIDQRDHADHERDPDRLTQPPEARPRIRHGYAARSRDASAAAIAVSSSAAVTGLRSNPSIPAARICVSSSPIERAVTAISGRSGWI